MSYKQVLKCILCYVSCNLDVFFTVDILETVTSPKQCSLLARVLQSKNPSYPVGCYVVAPCGWRTHNVTNGKAIFSLDMYRVLSDWPKDVPLSLAVGSLGMPG